jgi:hypothetical protein
MSIELPFLILSAAAPLMPAQQNRKNKREKGSIQITVNKTLFEVICRCSEKTRGEQITRVQTVRERVCKQEKNFFYL